MRLATKMLLTLNKSGLAPFSDDFARADGAVGNGWTGATWAISSGAVVNTPTLGAEVLTNGDMETGDPPTGWTTERATVTSDADAHGGSQALKLVATAGNGVAYQAKTLVAGTWYVFSAWAKALAGSAYDFLLQESTGWTTIGQRLGLTNTTYAQTTIIFRAPVTGCYIYLRVPTSGHTAYFDDATLKPLTTSTLIASRKHYSNADIMAALTPTSNRCGIIASLDNPANPQNYVLAYKENFLADRVYVDKVVNGALTNVGFWTTSAIAGGELELAQNGSTYQVYYRQTQLGTDLTISDAEIANNKYCGLWGAAPGDKLDNFLIQPVGDRAGGVVLTFDDGWDSDYTAAYGYAQPRGILGTSYVYTSQIGAANALSVAQIQEMGGAGWAIANHTQTHPDLTGLTQEQAEAELSAAVSDLTGWGLSANAQHVAYPSGAYNDTVLAAMAAAGMLSGRTTTIRTFEPRSISHYLIPIYQIGAATTLANVQAAITAAMANHKVVVIMFHRLVAAGAAGLEWLISDFQGLVDWLVAQGHPCLTIGQLYSRMLP